MNSTRIKAIVLDVDGVLTDGRLYLGKDGECLKVFFAQDGHAIKSWCARGGKIAFLSGRSSDIVQHRAAELGVEDVLQGIADKRTAFVQLAESWGLSPVEICYVGDDEPDMEVMRLCGLPVAVPGALEQVKKCAAFVTHHQGGRGAVREVIERLLNDPTGPTPASRS